MANARIRTQRQWRTDKCIHKLIKGNKNLSNCLPKQKQNGAPNQADTKTTRMLGKKNPQRSINGLS